MSQRRRPTCGHPKARRYAHGMCRPCYRRHNLAKGAEYMRRYRAGAKYQGRKEAILEQARINSAARYASPPMTTPQGE